MSFQKTKQVSYLVIAFTFLAGCTTAQQSIFRSVNLDSGRSLSTDANQRLIINTKTHPTSRPGRVNPERIICAEPSPDTAAIVANTLGFGLNVLGQGNAAAAVGQSSALAQLAERTVTVQLLRDQMYRACEAYANGAISGTEYSLLMSRNNDAMVTLMLGESASRIVGRNLVGARVSAGSSAEASMGIEIADAMSNLADATEMQQNAMQTLNNTQETAAAADMAMQNLPEDASEEARDNAEDNVQDAEDAKTRAEEEVEQTTQAADQAREAVARIVTSNQLQGNVQPGGFTNGAGTINQAAVDLAEHLVGLQEKYLDQGAEEHFISACVVELGNTRKPVIANESYYDDKNPGVDQELQFVIRERTYEEELIGKAFNAIVDLIPEIDVENFNLPPQDIIDIASYFAAFYNSLNDDQKEAINNGISNSAQLVATLAETTNLLLSAYRKKLAGDPAIDDQIISTYVSATRDLLILFFETYYDTREALQYGYPEKTAARVYADAASEQLDGIAGLFANKSNLADAYLRSHVALEERERMSLLARECEEKMPPLLDLEQRRNRERDELKVLAEMMVDLEEARNSLPAGSVNRPQSPNTPSTTRPDIAEQLARYNLCDDQSTTAGKRACRIRIVSAMVRNTAVTTTPIPSPRTAEQIATSGAFIIQLGAFRKKEDAEKDIEAHRTAFGDRVRVGENAFFLKAPVVGTIDNYRVRFGPFSSEKAGNDFCDSVDLKDRVNECRAFPIGAP